VAVAPFLFDSQVNLGGLVERGQNI
jgi:hypothetical protein